MNNHLDNWPRQTRSHNHLHHHSAKNGGSRTVRALCHLPASKRTDLVRIHLKRKAKLDHITRILGELLRGIAS